MKKQVLVSALYLSLLLGCSTPNRKPTSKLPPSLRNAEVKTLWIPDKVESDRFEEGHYLYIIEKPSTWRIE